MAAPESPSTSHYRVDEMLTRLRGLNTQLSRVTSSVCGNVPETKASGDSPYEDYLHAKLSAMTRTLSSLEEEMTRLENAIGYAESPTQIGQPIGQIKGAPAHY